jgi:small-conductance mechanosensitive channel
MPLAQEDIVLPDLERLTWHDWALSAGIFVGSLIVARIAGRTVRNLVARSPASEFVSLILSRLAKFVVVFLGFYFALQALGVPLGPLLGAMGIIGLALAFAFQDILENVVAGLLMLLKRPVAIGDEVETNGYLGKVTDITMRALELTSLDGETVFIPNAMVWKSPLINITMTPDRRTTIEVGVAYDTDLDRAKQVLEEAVAGVAGVEADPRPTAEVFQFGSSSIDFAVRYWHEASAATVWRLRDEVARATKRALDTAGIEIPFPQRVLHWAPGETASDG